MKTREIAVFTHSIFIQGLNRTQPPWELPYEFTKFGIEKLESGH